LALIAGCANSSQPITTASLQEAEQKLVDLCKKESNLDVVLFREPNRLWIYVPTESNFFKLEVSKDKPGEPQPPSEARTIYFLDTKFADNGFTIRYDIGKGKKSADSPGYGMKYSDEFQKIQRQVLTAVSQAFADVERREEEPGTFMKIKGDRDFINQEKNASHKRLVQAYIKTERVPDFFVIVLADIKNGLEAKMYFYLEDLNRGMVDYLFMEEYSRRVMNEGATGAIEAVGDKTGRHLKTHDLTWTEFLTKQISHRLKFKYAQSDFPPGDDTETEILKVVAKTINGYGFDAFETVKLVDIGQKKEYLFHKGQLAAYGKE